MNDVDKHDVNSEGIASSVNYMFEQTSSFLIQPEGIGSIEIMKK